MRIGPCATIFSRGRSVLLPPPSLLSRRADVPPSLWRARRMTLPAQRPRMRVREGELVQSPQGERGWWGEEKERKRKARPSPRPPSPGALSCLASFPAGGRRWCEPWHKRKQRGDRCGESPESRFPFPARSGVGGAELSRRACSEGSSAELARWDVGMVALRACRWSGASCGQRQCFMCGQHWGSAVPWEEEPFFAQVLPPLLLPPGDVFLAVVQAPDQDLIQCRRLSNLKRLQSYPLYHAAILSTLSLA